MLARLLSVMTPQVIIEAVKANPEVFRKTVQKFDTFKLISNALTTEQQLYVSANLSRVNDFLADDLGRKCIKDFAVELKAFIEKPIEEPLSKEALMAQLRLEIEQEIREKLSKEIPIKESIKLPSKSIAVAA